MPPQLLLPVKLMMVWVGPAPRSVTSLLSLKIIPGEPTEYVPAESCTTCPAGQLAIAELICAALAPEFSVVQIVERAGIVPAPACDHAAEAREGERMPDHCCA